MDRWNENLEIMGDLLDDVTENQELDPADDAEMEAHYQDWLARQGVSEDEQAEADAIAEWDWNEAH